MAAAGFADRSFPDGRVLRMCARSDETTAAQIGRGLGISRQGAGKIVAGLRERGYVTLEPSRTDAREKAVTLTPRARAFLAAHRRAAWTIEQRVHAELGDEAFDALGGLLEALGGDDQPRLRDYLRERTTLTEL
jgi:DNA-binding MarR family transcriptional regulator